MKRITLCILLISYPLLLLSQNKKADSLYRVLQRAKEDSNKINTLNSLSNILWGDGKYDTALVCSSNAREIALKIGFNKGVAEANDNIGIIYGQLGDYPKSLQYFFEALKIYQGAGNKKGIARNTGNIGIVYRLQGDYPNALKYFFKALKIYQELGVQSGIAINTGNIGVIYELQGNYASALVYYFDALKMMEEQGNKYGIANNTGNIGNVYDDEAGLVKSQNDVTRRDSLYNKALEYHFKALGMMKGIANKHGVAINMSAIGGIYTEQKKYKQAQAEYDSALVLAREIKVKDDMRDAYKGLAKLDSISGDYKNEVQDYKMYIRYRDSLINEANTKKSVQTAMNFSFEEKQAAEKAEQAKKDATAALESKRQVIVLDAFIAGFILVLLSAFFILRGYRLKQKANRIITRQKEEVESQKELVEEKQKEIVDSIHYAQRIQRALLASDDLLKNNLADYFVFYRPKDIVSGDFYWATKKKDCFYIAVCDSTGHGVPGAFMSLLNISFLNEAINEKNMAVPGEVLNHARQRLIENISQEGGQDGMDGILASLCANSGGAELKYAAAYNTPLLVRDNVITELPADKFPVGKSPKEKEAFTLHKTELKKGDALYMFTDGYGDQFGGERGKKFKYRQLQELLLANAARPMKEQKKAVEEAFESWKGDNEQTDDVCIVGMRI